METNQVVKSADTAANAVQAKEKRPNFIDVFMKGAMQGWNVGIGSMCTAVILAYTIIAILNNTGILDIIQTVFNPLMKVFGLPGAAFACIVAGFMTRPGGMAAALALYQEGVLTGTQVTIIVIPIMIIGGALQQFVRCVIVSGVENRAHKFLWAIDIVMTFVSIWIMNLLMTVLK